MKHFVLLFMALLASIGLWAADFEVNGIAYNIANAKKRTVYVTSKSSKYSGVIIIPSSVTYRGTEYSVKYIEKSAFESCTSLSSITIPNSVTSIGNQAFYNCSSLASVIIPDSVTCIGDDAFSSCSSLSSIAIPNSVTKIGDWVFFYCTSLTSIDVDAANAHYASVDGVLFNYAKDTLIQYPIGNTRTEYTIPNSVTRIRNRAFESCSTLSSVTIGNGVTSIGEYAFYECTSLTSITIPDSVTSIEDWTFYRCISLKSVTLPNRVIRIGNNVFAGCTSLSSIIIPNSVTSIGKSTFYKCTSIKSIICHAITPPTCGSSCFYYVDKSIPLYVPVGSIDAYKAAEGWKDFTNIQSIPDTPTAMDEMLDGQKSNVDSQKSKVGSRKIMIGGQLYIWRDGKAYNAQGAEVR